jgi:hypothetical protein
MQKLNYVINKILYYSKYKSLLKDDNIKNF